MSRADRRQSRGHVIEVQTKYMEFFKASCAEAGLTDTVQKCDMVLARLAKAAR